MFDNEAKVTSLIMRMSKVEKSVLNALAKKENLTLSDFIRKCVYSQHSVEEINGILADLKEFARVSEKDLNFPTLSDKKSIVISLSKEQMEEIDRLAEETGVSKVALARYRILNTKQVNIDLNLDFEGIEELKELIEAYTRTNRNMLRKVERSNMFTPKDVKSITENGEEQKNTLVKFVTNMIDLHSKTVVAIRKDAKKLLDSEKRPAKGSTKTY